MLNIGHKGDVAEHYDDTVELTFALLDIKCQAWKLSTKSNQFMLDSKWMVVVNLKKMPQGLPEIFIMFSRVGQTDIKDRWTSEKHHVSGHDYCSWVQIQVNNFNSIPWNFPLHSLQTLLSLFGLLKENIRFMVGIPNHTSGNQVNLSTAVG